MPNRTDIVAAARGWIGTPYHHQASLSGAGCDCLGLVRGVWRDLYGTEPETPPPYTPDWGEVGGTEHLLAAAGRHLRAVPLDRVRPGDLLLFRLKPNTVAKHVALLSGPQRMIHAQSGDAVREVALTVGWWRRATAAFAFPGIEG